MSIDYSAFKFSKSNKQQTTPLKDKKQSQANLVRNNTIKKVSKKRITVKQETYDKVLEICKGHCQFGNCLKRNIELHHIVYRSESKDLINDISNCIMLCQEHHLLVHKNKHKYQKIMKERRNKL